MHPPRIYLKSAAICILSMSSLWAGDEFLVNQTTPLDQRRAAVTQLLDGSIVLAWESKASGAGQIWRRRFTSDGVAQTPEKLVFGDGPNDQTDVSMASLSDGGYVLAWSRQNGDSDNYSVVYQKFDVVGNPSSSSPTQVNVTETGPQFHPQVSTLSGGGFVITWLAQNGDADQDIFYRRVGADGAFLDSTEIVANGLGSAPVTDGEQGGARVAGLKDGGFVIVYEDRESARVFGVRIDASGSALDAPGGQPGNKQVQISVSSDFEYSAPAVGALSTGGFVVAMNEESSSAVASRHVVARVFGDSVGDEFIVGSHTGRWERPLVTGLSSGQFLVGWQATGEGVDAATGAFSVWAQQFGADATPKNPPVMLNQFNDSQQRQVSVTQLADGGFGAAWQSLGQDGDGYGVYSRMFPAAAAVPGKLTIALAGDSVVQQFNISFTGTAGHTHELQGSTDFNNWVEVLTVSPADGKFSYIGQPGDVPYRFYRVITQ